MIQCFAVNDYIAEKKNCRDNKTWEATERLTPAVVLLDYVINFGLGVTDGFNIYTKDQRGRVPSNSTSSKNGPFMTSLKTNMCTIYSKII